MTTVTFDAETTIKNKGHPFTPENFMVSYSLKVFDGAPTFHYYTEPDFITQLRNSLATCTLLVGFNVKFDIHWLQRLGLDLPEGCSVYDCSLAEFVITGQEAVMVSLDDVLSSYGLPPKQDKVKEYWTLGIDTPDIPYEVLQEYNNLDVDNTYQLFRLQCDITNEKQHNLILLEGADLLTLVAAEKAGIKFDREACLTERVRYVEHLSAIQQELRGYIPALPVGAEFNWNSGDHTSCLLYGGAVRFEWRTEEEALYKSGDRKGQPYQKGTWHSHIETFPQRFQPLKNTLVKKCSDVSYKGTLYYQVDDPTLKQLKTRKNEDKRLLELLESQAKQTKVLEMFDQFLKLLDTYGWENNIIHGQYNQNIARTGRLSSSKPNLQNTPEELDKLLISRYV